MNILLYNWSKFDIIVPLSVLGRRQVSCNLSTLGFLSLGLEIQEIGGGNLDIDEFSIYEPFMGDPVPHNVGRWTFPKKTNLWDQSQKLNFNIK